MEGGANVLVQSGFMRNYTGTAPIPVSPHTCLDPSQGLQE